MARTLTIDAENDSQMEYALEEVLRLYKEGYRSGVDPSWDVEGEEEFDEDEY